MGEERNMGREKKLNVFIVNHYAIPPSLGGLVRHYYFSKYLREAGHQVRILSSSQVHNSEINFAEENQLLTEKNVDGITYSFVKTISYTENNWRRIANLLHFPLNAVRAIKKLDKDGDIPDVIYLSSPNPLSCYTVMRYAKKKKIPCVLEIRDLWPLSIVSYNNVSNNNFIIKILYVLERWLYQNADKLIFTMSGASKYIKSQGWEDKIDLNKITHINNGIDLIEFEMNKQKFVYKDNDLDHENYFNIIFTGSVRKIYQLDMIVETAKLCQNVLPNVRFFIFGDGPEKNSLEKLATEYNLENIFFKGKVEKKYIASILSRADVTLLHSKQVSLNEFGISQNKLFEYAAAKKPILATIQEQDSIITKYECGVQIDQQNSKTIFEAIRYIKDLSVSEREKMGNNAYILAQKHDYMELTKALEQVLISAI